MCGTDRRPVFLDFGGQIAPDDVRERLKNGVAFTQIPDGDLKEWCEKIRKVGNDIAFSLDYFLRCPSRKENRRLYVIVTWETSLESFGGPSNDHSQNVHHAVVEFPEKFLEDLYAAARAPKIWFLPASSSTALTRRFFSITAPDPLLCTEGEFIFAILKSNFFFYEYA